MYLVVKYLRVLLGGDEDLDGESEGSLVEHIDEVLLEGNEIVVLNIQIHDSVIKNKTLSVFS